MGALAPHEDVEWGCALVASLAVFVDVPGLTAPATLTGKSAGRLQQGV
jgi:hypothetical protein